MGGGGKQRRALAFSLVLQDCACTDVSHFSITWFVNFSKGKGKAVPLHAMEALGGEEV